MNSQKSPLKILSISLGRRGGFPVYGLEMTKALADLCEVNILVASGCDNIDDWRKLPCHRMEVSTYHNNLTGALSFFNVPKFLSIKKYIKTCKPDVVYYPGGHYWKPILDHLIPISTPIIMTVHDPVPHPGEDSIIAKIIDAMDKRKPDAYVLLNESQKNEFLIRNDIPEEKVIILPHGIFSSYIASLSSLDAFPEFESLLQHQNQYFLFVGRIAKYKGIATLLKAFGQVYRQTEKILVIAGSGVFSEEEKQEIEKIPSDRLYIFNHWLSDSEIATLTANAYMTVLPYEGATQSGVIPMSAAFGTPSIASDSGGLKEQIIHKKTGLLFQTTSVADLVHSLLEAAQLSNQTYEAMRKDSLAYANENWRWDIITEKLLRFIEKQIMR